MKEVSVEDSQIWTSTDPKNNRSVRCWIDSKKEVRAQVTGGGNYEYNATTLTEKVFGTPREYSEYILRKWDSIFTSFSSKDSLSHCEYITAAEGVIIDAATNFVKAHEDIYHRWLRRENQETSCERFMQLCEAVLSRNPEEASADGGVQCDGVSGASGEVVLQCASPGYAADETTKVERRKEDQVSSVNHPSHYNSGKIEVIAAIDDWKLGFSAGNAVKYIARAYKKSESKGLEDLKKAQWYLTHMINEIESNET